jgi:maleamate amidohydrolase
VVVPWDCVYDRSATSHAVNLFDMASKYADVAPAAEVLQKLNSTVRREHELQAS